ncbi:uroporphyrinogen decarboxylase [Philodulcilactobacillus myokoensis]|uniref:Uroporphyrinogen decarboxylase n=1 Tax=Philodulcilactobacillus myokoensis TaxID=2929573 RepID=A0A9W6B0G4_9LACO|nr:uroporphyrinogen decarboxylase family protein [Philodulcilactobacillus myokoensis]GLB46306.1 uroporphyrinogen decarboxylase [Philodulcilactobacillus myokoensis]
MDRNDVLTAFDNKDEKKVPFSVWHHFNPNEFLTFVQNPKAFDTDVKGESNYVKTVNSDFVKLMDDGYFVCKFNHVDNPSDLNSLSKIQELNDDDPWLTGQYHLISDQIKAIDKSKVVFSNVFSAVTLFKWAFFNPEKDDDVSVADHRFADLYLKDPKTVTNALKVITQDIKKQVRVAKRAGADGVFFSTQEIQDKRIGKDFFKNVQEKLDAEIIDVINQNFDTGILHVCGFAGATNHLPWFTNYKLPIINWATKIDGYTLGEGKKLFGNRVVLGGFGNTQDDVLYKGSKEQIQNTVDKLIDEAGTQGVILGADCTVPRDTPVNHIKWAEEAAHTYLKRKGTN